MQYKKFFMVLKADGHTSASMRHATFQDAINEASRLARKHNEGFYVLEAIGIVVPEEPPVTYCVIPSTVETF